MTKSGANIYDWELANMLKMWIGDKGFANMFIIFQQCFGGGMADDILKKLDGDIAILSAAKHDEPAWGYKTPVVNPYTKEVLKNLKEGKSAKDAANSAEKNDKEGPYSTKKYNKAVRKDREHPQYASEGDGDRIKLGRKSDGSQVKSKHAIIFGGENNRQRHWKNIKEFYDLLKGKGFKDEDIIVLADSGKTASHPYVDGPGTKKALWDAIASLSNRMNKSEQLVIYVTDHGNLETTDKALNRVVGDPVKQPVPPVNEKLNKDNRWVLDDSFLAILNLSQDNVPYISLIVEPSEEIIYDEERADEFLSYICTSTERSYM